MKQVNLQHLFRMSLLASSIALTACGTETIIEDNSQVISQDVGQLDIMLRDAAEDFLTYAVDISQITLTRADGAVVNVLPNNPRVDFVEYQTLSEFFSSQTIASGVYTHVAFTLDYSSSEIIIKDELGNPIVASAIDAEGNPLSQYTLDIALDEQQQLAILPGKAAALTLDFDLAASNTILSTAPALVEVSPILVVDAELDSDRDHRVRGLLQSSDESSITLDIKPFRFKDGDFGRKTLNFDENTQFEINGELLSLAQASEVLASLAADTPIIAYGRFDKQTEQWLMASMQVGTSVPWHNQDLLRGVAVANDNGSISLKGVVIEPQDRTARFVKTTTLISGDQTKINSWNGQTDLAPTMIAVGSKIQALGQWQETETGTSFNVEDGLVRLKISRITAKVNEAEGLNVNAILANKHSVNWYQWQDNSTSPDSMSIKLNGLTPQTTSGDWVQIRGNFIKSGDFDFDAQSVTKLEFESQKAVATVYNLSQSPVANLVENKLVLDQAATKHLKLASIPLAISEDLDLNSINFADSGEFVIKKSFEFSLQTFTNSTEFLQEIAKLIEQGAEIKRVTATGIYQLDGQEITSSRCLVVVK
ncbi:DUF4382 domain-containing protein [Paraferrimonas sp. SM1919]|uniref:DUF4382 domain-containing protein n=1 Tax=Paraferrimonas sp. SM1919 TaxID=2662263 RepID=UPI0013D0FE2E|nr:DUF4382 domain-containing protein [Paraferrimonas sp. SM1919]